MARKIAELSGKTHSVGQPEPKIKHSLIRGNAYPLKRYNEGKRPRQALSLKIYAKHGGDAVNKRIKSLLGNKKDYRASFGCSFSVRSSLETMSGNHGRGGNRAYSFLKTGRL